MKEFLTFIISTLSFLFVSCLNMNKNHNYSIEKVWQWNKYTESTYYYRKASDINDDKEGFQFLSDGKLKVRQNVGWCGTPPITYETVLGSWNKTSDSTIRLEYPYWDGKIINDILIVEISKSELKFRSINLQRLK